MYITVSHGMRGWFALLADSDGPVQSGIGSYATAEEAAEEARAWALAERLQFLPLNDKAE